MKSFPSRYANLFIVAHMVTMTPINAFTHEDQKWTLPSLKDFHYCIQDGQSKIKTRKANSTVSDEMVHYYASSGSAQFTYVSLWSARLKEKPYCCKQILQLVQMTNKACAAYLIYGILVVYGVLVTISQHE